MTKHYFVYDQKGNCVDLRKTGDVGAIASHCFSMIVDNPSDDQLKYPFEYKPTADQKGIVLDEEKRTARIIGEQKLQINLETEKKILEILDEDTKQKALIEQINMQSKANQILAAKIVDGRYPNGGEAELKQIAEIEEKIKAILKAGRALKAKLKGV